MKTTVFAILIFTVLSLQAADSTSTNISLRTFLEQDGVPLNKEVVYHIELSWEGDLQRFNIKEISEPVLNNLKLRGSGSSNRFYLDEQGKPHALKRITYYFTPLEIGMGYVDGVTVRYENKASGQSETLFAQRIGVKIIEADTPGALGMSAGRLLLILIVVIFIFVVAYFIFKFFKVRKEQQDDEELVLSDEQKYQAELEALMKESGKDARSDFNRLTHLLKRYLNTKFGVANGATFEIVQPVLQENEMEPDLISKVEKLYRQSELSAFAGEAISEAEFHLFADTVELVIKSQENTSIKGE